MVDISIDKLGNKCGVFPGGREASLREKSTNRRAAASSNQGQT